MQSTISILQFVSAILIILLILVQNRGAGLSQAFGGSGGFYATKRGAEKILFRSTIVMLTVFIVLSFLATVLR